MSIDRVFEYVEIYLDSGDAVAAGGTNFKNPGVGFDPSIASFSWPLFSFTKRRWKVAGFKVLSADIPFFYDNINNGNNKFIYVDTGVSYTVRIPEGNYTTGASVATAVQAALIAIRPGFSVTFSTTTLKFTFSPPGAFAWSLRFPGRDSAYSVLGFLVDGVYSNVGSFIVSKRAAEWYGSKYLYLNSDIIGPLIHTGIPDDSSFNGISTHIAKIPIEFSDNTGFIHYEDSNTNNFFDFFTYNHFDLIDLYLTPGPSEGQKPLDLRGLTWSVKLGLLVYRDPSRIIEDSDENHIIIK